jgi:RimJ/RimL family protein N-acetyltransferase
VSFTAAPVISTNRLTLRGHRVADFAALHAMWTEPVVYEFITGRPSTPEESWARLLRYAGHWKLLGYGYWAVEERATARFVGEMGFADYHRAVSPALKDTPELGWVLSPAVHRRGLATEALSAIIEWGDRNFTARRTACIVAPENLASLRVAKKLGFVEDRRTTYNSAPTVLLYRAAK